MARKRSGQADDSRSDPGKAFGARQRADLLLVAHGLFDSRAQAQAAIHAGRVRADGVIVVRPSETLPLDALIEATAAHPFVSRGGIKLDAALAAFPLEIAGRTCLDVGASTGGFSQVLLMRGAAKIFAVDVGHDQLHSTLQGESRLVSMEGTDIRNLNPGALDPPPEIVVIDASFISLRNVLPAALRLAAPDCAVLALIKPQFELARSDLKKGIVRDADKQQQVCANIAAFAAERGLHDIAIFESAITGGDGNREFFLGARRTATR